MNYEELDKLVDQELQWLRYYATAETRQKLNINSDLYTELKSIGYTKRVIPLDRRCPAVMLTANTKIDISTDIETIIQIGEPRDKEKNCFTPLEFYLIKYPERKQWAIDKLN